MGRPGPPAGGDPRGGAPRPVRSGVRRQHPVGTPVGGTQPAGSGTAPTPGPGRCAGRHAGTQAGRQAERAGHPGDRRSRCPGSAGPDTSWRRPEATAQRFFRADGLFPQLRTGDYGWLDDGGYLYFTGRRDDLYKANGFRVSAARRKPRPDARPGWRAPRCCRRHRTGPPRSSSPGPPGPTMSSSPLCEGGRYVRRSSRGRNGVTLTVLVRAANALPLLSTGTTEACTALRERVLDGRATVALAATDCRGTGFGTHRAGHRDAVERTDSAPERGQTVGLRDGLGRLSAGPGPAPAGTAFRQLHVGPRTGLRRRPADRARRHRRAAGLRSSRTCPPGRRPARSGPPDRPAGAADGLLRPARRPAHGHRTARRRPTGGGPAAPHPDRYPPSPDGPSGREGNAVAQLSEVCEVSEAFPLLDHMFVVGTVTWLRTEDTEPTVPYRHRQDLLRP